MLENTLRFSARNVALAYVILSLIVLGLFATPLWYAWRTTIDQSRTEMLQADANKLKRLFEHEGADALATVIDARVGGLYGETGKYILLTDAAKVRRAGNLPAWPSALDDAPGMHDVPIDVNHGGAQVAWLHQVLPGGYHLLVGRDVARFERLESLFRIGLLGCAAAVLLFAVLGGLLIRRALLSKVHGISQTTAAIVEGDLSRRLPMLAGEDELAMLTETVNRMLDQIEHLLHSVRDVSNAIAHDLRTPLAELRSRLEELSLVRPDPDETFSEIEGAIADVDQVIAIFNALLRLAEIDSGTRRAGFVGMDVTKVAAEVAEFYHPVAELKGIALSFSCAEALPTIGDPLLLAQAIGNLIDNALKYAPKNGAITIEALRRADLAIEVAVADDGPGIPAELKPRVLERFYRADASRGTPGAGLGLSLVAAVAKLHGGGLRLTDNHPGLRATLVLFGASGAGSAP
jgi:signal transduction histidine kinase